MYAKRTDKNHAEIRDAMRDAGCEVEDMSGAGGGFPDTVVRTPDDRQLLVEIKTPTGKLTPAQVKFHARFRRHIVRSVEDALGIIKNVHVDASPPLTPQDHAKR